jgi:valyl-tRNA synthetase
MPREIPKAYEPQAIEQRWSRYWVDEALFRADVNSPGPVFSIVIPPPNVTGSIHIGHMLEHTQIDLLVRWHRMRGFNTLWLPGMDHAGIATQVVVERQLAQQGLKRQELGREEFERRVWEWKAQSGGAIKQQMIRLGTSCDWSRERFTLDPPLYRAVLEAFLCLYKEGLIYRGRYIVNWCPRCMTALSDLETVHEERSGHLWYIRYPVMGTNEHIVVATTRPETMLGDTAVVVHPDDERYKHLIGKKVRLPLMDREIPIIADATVDREFATGAVKVTPAHDPNDFEIGIRHNLPQVEVMTDDGHMNHAVGQYADLDRFDARKQIVADLNAQDLLDKVVNHTHSVGICDRCKTVVEPRVSTQWFCKMKPLAEPASKVVREGLIPIIPENQKKIFLDWMDNIRDWCISRQLWWGHRIPVWHCADCGGMTPARDSRVEMVNGRAQAASPPEKCGNCGKGKLTQDPDVLDTWFSSSLWPFSTLGWPDQTPDLDKYYPTSLLISGYDILFFWDARMIMMGLHFAPGANLEERIPFRSLYLHQLVRDPEGVKMSKTRGNVIDPLTIIEQHGTDALRFTLAIMAAPGTDIALSDESILSYRAFANKIWNAARFLLLNVSKNEQFPETLEQLAAPEMRMKAPLWIGQELPLIHRWMFSRLTRTTSQVNFALENLRFHEAAHVVYHFFWGDFCDWYIEWLKPDLDNWNDPNWPNSWRNIFSVFEAALRLLHPFMPFLTEELWHQLPQREDAKSIALDRFPELRLDWMDEDAESQISQIQEIIVKARSIRADMKVDKKTKTAARIFYIPGPQISVEPQPFLPGLISENLATILRLSLLSHMTVSSEPLEATEGPLKSTPTFDIQIPYAQLSLQSDDSLNQWRDLTTTQLEIARLKKETQKLAIDIEARNKRLADGDFRNRAPQNVIEAFQAKLQQHQAEYQKLTERLAQLEKSAGGATAP